MKTLPVLFWFAASGLVPAAAAPSVTRVLFTPPVVPTTRTESVRFEATITENPASVALRVGGVDRAMADHGLNGDRVAGDGVWTIQVPASDILSRNTTSRQYRPVLGSCTPAGGGSFNVIAEVWTPTLGLPEIRGAGADGQWTDHVLNLVGTPAQLTNLDARFWARKLYERFPDRFDFINFVLVGGRNGNRHHVNVRNFVAGIRPTFSDTSAEYGSAGRLQGYNVFPFTYFYDAGNVAFNHETGHQWINGCVNTPFASGIPHWPKGSMAINVMGFNVSGSVGGTYNHTFAPDGNGGYTVGPGAFINTTTFNALELYLMGLVPAAQVPSYFILKDQTRNLSTGQVLTAAEVTEVGVQDIVNVHGARIPSSTAAQQHFRCATLMLSEEPLDAYAMSLYTHLTRRAEATQPHLFADGLFASTCNPWYVATGGRSIMHTRLVDEVPVVEASEPTPDGVRFHFLARPGTGYQLQESPDLQTWVDVGTRHFPDLGTPPVQAPRFLDVPYAGGATQRFFRLVAHY